MAKTLSIENIAEVLKQQQKVVGIIDEYIQPIPLRLVPVVFSILCESRVRSFPYKTQRCRSRISKLYKDKIN